MFPNTRTNIANGQNSVWLSSLPLGGSKPRRHGWRTPSSGSALRTRQRSSVNSNRKKSAKPGSPLPGQVADAVNRYDFIPLVGKRAAEIVPYLTNPKRHMLARVGRIPVATGGMM